MFRRQFELVGDSLVRAPKGYDPEHPLIEELRRKDHMAMCRLEVDDLFVSNAVTGVARRFRAAAPYMAWLCKAVDVKF